MKIEKLRLEALNYAHRNAGHGKPAVDIISDAEDYLTFIQYGYNPKNNIINNPPQHLYPYHTYPVNFSGLSIPDTTDILPPVTITASVDPIKQTETNE